MTSSTTMTRASERWFGADAGGRYFEDAFVLLDEEAARCAHGSIGGGGGRGTRGTRDGVAGDVRGDDSSRARTGEGWCV